MMRPDSEELPNGPRTLSGEAAPNSVEVASPQATLRERKAARAPGADAQPASEAPLVSVVIPCYNHAHFLGEAIRSVLQQTYRLAEVVVVDDGSADHTRDVAVSYPGVRYVNQENQGLAAARNTGIRESKGSYLVFLDADDRLLPTALEAGINSFRAHPECAFVFGTYRTITSDGSPFDATESTHTDLYRSLALLLQNYVDNNHYRALLQGNYIGMHATVMYRRSALESVKGFNQMLAACEDYDLYLRIARNLPVYYHAEMVAEYRIHNTNMSRNPELMLRTALTVLHAQKKYVKADEHHKEAYESGIKFWKEYYGDELVSQVKSGFGTHGKEGEQGFQGAMTLLRYAPELLSPSQYPRLAIVMMLLRRDPERFIVNIVKRIRRVGLKTVKTFFRRPDPRLMPSQSRTVKPEVVP